MRRPVLLLSLLLVLGQLALGLHQSEHRLQAATLDQGPCGICAIADHLGGAPAPISVLPSVSWVAATYQPVFDQRPGLARPAEIRARAPPASFA